MTIVKPDVVFTWNDDPAQQEPFVRCAECGADLCTIEEGDTLDTIVGVAEDHACPVQMREATKDVTT